MGLFLARSATRDVVADPELAVPAQTELPTLPPPRPEKPISASMTSTIRDIFSVEKIFRLLGKFSTLPLWRLHRMEQLFLKKKIFFISMLLLNLQI